MPGGKKRIMVVLLVLLIIASVFAAAAVSAYSSYKNFIFEPISESGQNDIKEVEIKSGSTSKEIIDVLYDEGLIRNKTALRVYLKISNLGGSIKAGRYELHKGMSAEDIINKMVKGQVKRDTVKVTIPEGYEIKEIAAAFEKAGLADKDKFIEATQNVSYDYDFLKSLPSRPVKLEGYLFPDTYEFSKNVTPEEIVKRMLGRFNEVFNEEMIKKAESMNLTIDQVVTMASIVEREARASDERPVIAAVFYNRIKKKMRLESCATVQYALGERKENLLYKDLEIDSPYNTYKKDGLPVGPIANPGKASIEAALNPADADYLFFVLKDGTSGTHAFSNNYNQFLKDKQKYYQNLK